jgi:glycosyltransferase involved in cell wall biosynthesis
MTIAYDAKRLFQNLTGLGNYSRTLLQNLATFYPNQDYQLFAPKIIQHPSTHFFLAHKNFSLHTPSLALSAYWRSHGMIKDFKKSNAQIFHGLSHELPFGIQKSGIKSVVTMHDLVFKIYPNYTPYFQRTIYDLKFRYACNNADIIIAISEQTKQDIVHFYGINPSKISVAYQTCNQVFQDWSLPTIDLNFELPDAYMLYVGSVIERKNLYRIVEAMSLLPKSSLLPLVVVGSGGAYLKKVKDLIHSKGLDNKIIFIEKLIYEQLPQLYRNATLFLYPSEYEGFGIPVIEALFSKTPVITSNVSCLPEAAGKDSILVNPKSAEAIADGIQQVLNDSLLRKKMVENGFDYANKNFNAQITTARVQSIYNSLLSS